MITKTNTSRSKLIFSLILIISVNASRICVGGDACCSERNKCGEMEGDCDSDIDCLEGLKCGENNCNANSGNWASTDDCCFKPKGIQISIKY